MDNPYKAPTTPVRDPPAPPRSPIAAVLAGLAVDLGGTFVVGIAVGVVYAATLAAEGKAPEQIQEAMVTTDASSGYFIALAAVGGLFSLLGGYVCARVARRNELRVTAFLALLVVVLGFLMSGDSESFDAGVLAALNLLTIAAVLLGGEIGRRRNLARAQRDSAGVGMR